MPELINIRDHGAQNNEDATRILQDFFQDESNRGNSIYIPKGTYLISGTVKIINWNDIKILGNGTLKFIDGLPVNTRDGTQMFHFNNCNNITIEGLSFDGNRRYLEKLPDRYGTWNSFTPRKYYTPIDIQDSHNIMIRGCNFREVSTSSINFDHSQHISIVNNEFYDCFMDAIFTQSDKPPVNSNVMIIGNIIKNINYDHPYGNGMIVNADNLIIAANTIDNVDRTGIKPTDLDNNDIHIKNIVVMNNKISRCKWSGINSQAGKNIKIRGNIISDIGHTGISIAHGAEYPDVRIENVVIKNNIIKRTGLIRGLHGDCGGTYEGIDVITDIENVKIIGNIIDTTQRKGIRLLSPINVIIENNFIKNTEEHSIELSTDIAGNIQCSIVTIRENTFIQSTGLDIFPPGSINRPDITIEDNKLLRE